MEPEVFEDGRVYCADCGSDVTGKKYFLSPTRTPHCSRCVHPTRLDRLLRDRQVRVLGVQLFLLAIAAVFVFDMINNVANAR